MEIIRSASNSHIKALRELYTRKGRLAQGKYVVEGVNIVKDIPPTHPVCAYYVAADRYEELAYIYTSRNVPVYVVEDDLLRRVVDTVNPSGIVAVLPIPSADEGWRACDRLLVLDGVADPGNVGTILRTAIAAGIEHVVMLGGVDPYNPKVVRASMGGIYRLGVHCIADVAELDADRQYILLDMHGTDVYHVVPSLRHAIVVGSEASGASPAMRARADVVASIPMQGGIESLNAAVACAVALYVLQANK